MDPTALREPVNGPDDDAVERRVDRRSRRVALAGRNADEEGPEPARRVVVHPPPAVDYQKVVGLPVTSDEPYPTAIVPAGYQISTAADMARYAAALSNHGLYRGTDIVGNTGGDRDYGIYWEPLSGVTPGWTPGGSRCDADRERRPHLHAYPASRCRGPRERNPTQLWFGDTHGAFEIGFDVLRLAWGEEPMTGGYKFGPRTSSWTPCCSLLAGILVVEVLRLRGWRRRLAAASRPRLALVPSFVVDIVLPLSILVALPLWISTMGISPQFDVLGTWALAMWVLPDVGASLVAISAGLLIVGLVKAWQLWPRRSTKRNNP